MLFLPPLIPPLSIGKFDRRDVRSVISRCIRDNHEHRGLTLACPPAPSVPGLLWSFDHVRIMIGHGTDEYERAVRLLQAWGQFQLPWAFVDRSTPTAPGTPLCVEAQPMPLPLWVACPLKIVYNERNDDAEIDLTSVKSARVYGERGSTASSLEGKTRGRLYRYGHTTLEGHYLAGEERFQVEWHKCDDSVWYEVCAVSRPAHALAVVLFPFVRFCQRRFGKASAEAMAASMRLEAR